MSRFQAGDPRTYRGGRAAWKTPTIDAWAFATLWYQPEIPTAEIARYFKVSIGTVGNLAKRYGLTPRMVLLEKAKLGPWKRKAAA